MTRPTCEQLARSPELASLAPLDVALDISSLALAAVWPEQHEMKMARQHDEPRAALEILQRAEDMTEVSTTSWQGQLARVGADDAQAFGWLGARPFGG